MKIIVSPVNGLANRLRCMASCFILAEQTGREFEIMWRPYCGCNIDFLDLFEEHPFSSKKLDYDHKSIMNDDHWITEGDDKNLLHTTTSAGKQRTYIKHTEWQRGDWILNSPTEELVVMGGGNIRPSSLSVEEFSERKRQFYNQLSVRPEIQAVADSFLEPYKGKSILGLQIRATDHARRGGKCSDTSPEGVYSHAKEAVAPYLSKYDYVYVCSDDIRIVKLALADLPNSTTFQCATLVDNDGSDSLRASGRHLKEGIIEAAISWLILSRCDGLLYSFKSSFGEEAGIKSGNETIPYKYS